MIDRQTPDEARSSRGHPARASAMLDQPGLDVDADKARRIPRDEVSLPRADVENPPSGRYLV